MKIRRPNATLGHSFVVMSFAWISAVTLPGCGVGVEQLLIDTGNSLGQTFLDVLLTEFANAVVDLVSPTGNTGTGTGGDTTGGDDTGGGSTGGDLSALTGDATSGQTLYGDNGCAACHCADAVGNCALSAPPVVGASAFDIDLHLRGANPHPIKPALTDQEIVDLAAYLQSLP